MSPALTFFLEPIRVALDVDRRRMVKELAGQPASRGSLRL